MLKRSQKGVALLEFIASFYAFLFLMAVFYASFGVIHSSILGSIAARNYAFSIIENRSDINFHRECKSHLICNVRKSGYFNREVRFFGNTKWVKGTKPKWIAPVRSIDFSPTDINQRGVLGLTPSNRSNSVRVGSLTDREVGEEEDIEDITTKVYIKQSYGICLNSKCGD